MGTTLIRIVGSSDQPVTGVTVSSRIPSFQIASTGGTVTFVGTPYFRRNYTYTSGTDNTGTSSVKFFKPFLIRKINLIYWNPVDQVMYRMFRNAFENSLSFAKSKVIVEIRHSSNKGLYISIQDDGPGLSIEQVSHF